MKLIAIFFVAIIVMVAFASATICARDNRAGKDVNFDTLTAMYLANGNGGGKWLKVKKE